ncbi:stmnd1 [Pungitius sinensis]
MGCNSSSNTAVRPLRPEEKGDEDEAGSKVDGRGDSAVSKVTTDSGVVMDNRDIAVLPGAVLRNLTPLSSEDVGEGDAEGITEEGITQQESTLQERPKTREILEELLNQGIIPLGHASAHEAYSIVLDDGQGVRRKPPVRLESLKASKAQSVTNIDDIEEKIRLAGDRRTLEQDKLKMRLRMRSAHVRSHAPTSSTEEDEETDLTPVEPLQLPPTPNPLVPHSQITREEAEGGEWVREAVGDGREDINTAVQKGGKGGERGETTGQGVSEDGDRKGEDEVSQVEELTQDSLFR